MTHRPRTALLTAAPTALRASTRLALRASARPGAALALAAVLATGCAGAPGPVGPAAGAVYRAGPAAPTHPLERELFDRVNRDRAGQGLRALAWDEALAEVARAHSRDMAAHDFVAHDSPRTGSMEDRLRAARYLARAARENLALHEDVQGAEDGLLKSPGHRANLFASEVTHMGLGVIPVSRYGGAVYVTQLFSRPWVAAPPAEVCRSVRRQFDDARRRLGLPAVAEDPALQRAAEGVLARLRRPPQGEALQQVSRDILEAADPDGARGLGGVAVLSTDLLDGADLQIPPSVLDGARAVAVATAPARDDQGRPVVRVLVVAAMGRRR